MLIDHTLFGVIDKVKIAIDRLKAFEPPEGYYLAFSGGKDSQCIYHLAQEAGVKFDAHFSLTTVDPPEVIRFVKARYPDVTFEKPPLCDDGNPLTMWRLIPKKRMPPTRTARYCCRVYKEGHGNGRVVVTGVRWAESVKRKKNRAMVELNHRTSKQIMLNNDNAEERRMYEACQMKGKHILNPIVDWTEEDVWEYLNSKNIDHCCLYDEGFRRIGCIGCPMSGTKGMKRGFDRWPKYEAAYLRAFDRMLVSRHEAGLETFRWTDAQSVMDWWIGEKEQKAPDDGYLFDKKGEGYH